MHDATIIIVMLATIWAIRRDRRVGYSSIYALGRNPSSRPSHACHDRYLDITGALTIIALLVFFHLFGK